MAGVDAQVLLQLGGALGLVAYWIYETRRGRIAKLYADVSETKGYVKAQAVITRAMARTDNSIDSDLVDEYLAENGIEPGDFILADRRDPPSDDD